MEVRELPTSGGLLDRICGAGASAVLLTWKEAASEAGRRALATLAVRDDAPRVIVLGDHETAEERSDLIAIGAATVLAEDVPGRRITEALEAVASARADGKGGKPLTGGERTEPRLSDFLSRSPTMREFLDVVEQVADSDSLLLIAGETGVGKEHLARAIHAESARAKAPFVTLNCGALPEGLLESELFGHEAGAYTGAKERHAGHFEQADGGTIFLDEIGELPRHLQVRLLNVLQRHELQRLGGEEPITLDVRVMAATNRDLEADVREGRFREDLYYRLNVVPLVIPPLRERREDLPGLVGSFIRHFRERLDRKKVEGIDAGALGLLVAHAWPGNLRELINVIERAMLLCRGDRIRRADLPADLGGSLATKADAGLPLPDRWLERPLSEVKKQVTELFERRYLTRLLEQNAGRIGDTAVKAGIVPRTLYEKMRRHGLRKEDYR